MPIMSRVMFPSRANMQTHQEAQATAPGHYIDDNGERRPFHATKGPPQAPVSKSKPKAKRPPPPLHEYNNAPARLSRQALPVPTRNLPEVRLAPLSPSGPGVGHEEPLPRTHPSS